MITSKIKLFLLPFILALLSMARNHANQEGEGAHFGERENGAVRNIVKHAKNQYHYNLTLFPRNLFSIKSCNRWRIN
jgi:hypothetical protein